MVKNPPANVGGWGWISGGDREDTLEKEMATHSSILPGESHRQRSLMGSHPWSHKESDTTERLNTDTGEHSWNNTRAAKWTLSQQLKTHYFRTENLKQYSKVITAQAEASSAGLCSPRRASAIQGRQPQACLEHHLSIPSRQGNKVPRHFMGPHSGTRCHPCGPTLSHPYLRGLTRPATHSPNNLSQECPSWLFSSSPKCVCHQFEPWNSIRLDLVLCPRGGWRK